MRTHSRTSVTMKTLVTVGTLVGAALTLAACGDVKGSCLVQRRALGGYAVVLDRQGDASGGAGCDTALPARLGDVYTFDKYGADQTELSMRPLSLAAIRVTTDPDTQEQHWAFSTKSFDTAHPDTASGRIGISPDAQGICSVESMSPVEQDVVFQVDGVPEAPLPRSIAVQGLRFLSSPQYQGAQLAVTATYGRGACSATYAGLGITPLVSCQSDDDCFPFVDPGTGHPTASGINPAFPVTCNKEVGALFPVRFAAASAAITTGNTSGVCWLTGSTFPVIR